jgi:ABC-type bacteriocin/lantibiotic exporter with double-glycine peptidase domain
MIDLPNMRQTFNYDCGAKALQIVLAYYGVEVREDELMSQLGCNIDGTPLANMISIAEGYGFKVEATRGTSLETLKQYVEEGYPVIILLQAWAERYMTLEDWREDIDDGHYVIVIDYINNILVFEDPSSFHRTWLTEEELLARWHDVDPTSKQRLDHFAMVLKGKDPAEKKIVRMK